MSILKALIALLIVGWFIGCEGKPINQAIIQCEQKALDNCTKIGQGSNHLCYLVYAKSCSTEDYVAAHKECLRIVGETPNSNAECVLHWP